MRAITVTSSTVNAIPADFFINCNCSSNAIEVTLYNSASYPGAEITIKKVDSGVNAVTVKPFGTETIGGASSVTISAQNEYITFKSIDTGWIATDNNDVFPADIKTIIDKVDPHIAGSADNHGSDDITNETDATGTTLSDAVDNIYDRIENGNDTVTDTDTAQVISLPATAIKSPVVAMELEGNTTTNIVTNGNFTNITGWDAQGGSSNAASSNTLSNTGTGAGAAPRANQTTAISGIQGNRVFSRAKVRVTNANATFIYLNNEGGNIVDSQTAPTQNQWYVLYGIYTMQTTGAFSIQIEHRYADAATANGKVMQVQEVLAIDLDQHPQFDGMTADEINTAVNWFNGTKSVAPQRIKMVGKNLFDKSRITDNFYVKASDGTLVANTAYFSSDYIKIEPSTAYAFNYGVGSAETGLAWYDINKNYISGSAVAENTSYTRTSPANASWLRVNGNRNVAGTTPETYMVEKGSTATTYEPYTDTEVYLPVTIRSVTTATDTFDAKTGDLAKKVSDVVSISNTDYDTYITTNTNVDVVKTIAFSAAKAGTTAINGQTVVLNKDGVLLEEVASADVDNTDSIGKYYYDSDKKVSFILAKAAYGTQQIETATCTQGATIASGNITVTVTAAGMSNSPKAVVVAVAQNDTVNDVAGKVRVELAADPDVSSFFTVSGADADVVLTAINVAANDATMAIAVVDTDTTGVTFGASANTEAGVAGIAGARTGLDTSSIYYELATYVNLSYPAASLVSEVDGTLYVEPVIKESVVHAAGAVTISNSTYPITTLLEVTKVTGETRLVIPVSTTTVAGNGLSFTSTQLVDTDVVEFKYEYSSALSTIPTSNAEYARTSIRTIVEETVSELADFSDFTIAYLLNLETRVTALENP